MNVTILAMVRGMTAKFTSLVKNIPLIENTIVKMFPTNAKIERQISTPKKALLLSIFYFTFSGD